MKIAIYILEILTGVFIIGCLSPQSIDVAPDKINTPPVITSFTPKEGYVIMNFGDEKLFSVDSVKDENPKQLTYTWKLDGVIISDGTFVRIMAPNTSKIMELEVIVNDGYFQDMVRWTIIVGYH